MSGFYNMLFGDGTEKFRGMMLAATLDLRVEDFGRFRDAWVEQCDDGSLQIAFYTRNGGGNRPDYADVTEALQQHPAYLNDQDDDFDSTYATYRFRFPDECPFPDDEDVVKNWPDLRAQLVAGAGPVIDTDKRWQDAIQKLQTDGPSEQMMASMAPVIEALKSTVPTLVGDVQITPGQNFTTFFDQDRRP